MGASCFPAPFLSHQPVYMGSLPGNNKWTRKRATYQNIIKAKLMKRWQNFGYCLKLLWRSCLKYPFRMTHQSCNSELPQGATSHYDPTCQCFNKAYQHITLCPSFQWALTKLPHIFLLWSIVARSHQDTPGLSISFSAAHTLDMGLMKAMVECQWPCHKGALAWSTSSRGQTGPKAKVWSTSSWKKQPKQTLVTRADLNTVDQEVEGKFWVKVQDIYRGRCIFSSL